MPRSSAQDWLGVDRSVSLASFYRRRGAAPKQTLQPSMLEMRKSVLDLVVKSQLRDDGCSAEDSRKWVAAVAFGKTVRVDRGGGEPAERRAFPRPAFDVCARNVFFTRVFSQRYHVVETIFRDISDLRDSKWRVVGAGSSWAGRAHGINTVANLFQLLGGIIKDNE